MLSAFFMISIFKFCLATWFYSTGMISSSSKSSQVVVPGVQNILNITKKNRSTAMRTVFSLEGRHSLMTNSNSCGKVALVVIMSA